MKRYLVEVTALTIEDTPEEAGRFSFVVNDPGSRWLDQGLFEPGKPVEVEIGYAGKLSPMISGKIDSLHPGFPVEGNPRLEISGRDSSGNSSLIGKQRSFTDSVVSLKYGSSLLSFDLNVIMPTSEKQVLPQVNPRKKFESLIRGRGCSIGLPDLRPGKNVELIGLGSKFSGDYHVESSTHTINNSGYTTSFEVRKTHGVELE